MSEESIESQELGAVVAGVVKRPTELTIRRLMIDPTRPTTAAKSDVMGDYNASDSGFELSFEWQGRFVNLDQHFNKQCRCSY